MLSVEAEEVYGCEKEGLKAGRCNSARLVSRARGKYLKSCIARKMTAKQGSTHVKNVRRFIEVPSKTC